MAENKEKQYVSDNAQLMSEWNWEKNNALGLDPQKLTCGTSKKAWWRCSKGHEWEATINNRSKGRNCPYCSNKKVLTGYNDLKSQYPELMEEWNYEKNTVDPEQVSYGSDCKVWWKCSMGHEWEAKIYFRTTGHRGCPICARETQTSFPEQTLFYYLKKLYNKVFNRYIINGCEIDVYIEDINTGIEYDGYFFHSSKKALELEKHKNEQIDESGVKLYRIKENENKENIYFEGNTFYLPRKHNDFLLKSVLDMLIQVLGLNTDDDFVNITRDRSEIQNNYILSSKEKSISTLYPELANEWNYEKNGSLKPEMFTATSHKKVWWKCSFGHEWEAMISNRTDKGRACPYCVNQKIHRDNSVAVTHPQILEFWDFEKNEVSPYNISYGADKVINFKCNKNHEFSALLYAFVATLKCPICQNRKVLVGYNDLATTHPDLCKEWNYEKNIDLTPQDITYGSGKKVWWICEHGHEWQVSPNMRTCNKTGCPICAKKKK